jgi:hypothetical protein
MLKKSIIPGVGLQGAAAIGALLTSALLPSATVYSRSRPAVAAKSAPAVPAATKAPKMKIDTIKPAARNKSRPA